MFGFKKNMMFDFGKSMIFGFRKSMKFGFNQNATFDLRKSLQRLAIASTLAIVATSIAAPSAHAQRRTRRESNANRKARIERTIQETYSKRYELFGGGGFLRFRSGELNQRNAEVTWATSGTYFLNPKLGITADVRGAYGNAKVGNTIYNIGNPLITEYTFMGGATYHFYAKQKYAISGNVLAGYALGNFDGGSKAIPATALGLWKTSNRPVFSAGVSFDYNFYPNLALRMTPTYVGTTFNGIDLGTGKSNGSLQNNIGFNAGIVYRFGKIK